MKSEKEYLASPNNCPHCDCGNVSGSMFEVDDYGAWQDITCSSCGNTWTDHYKLVGVSFDAQD